jgi:CBS domain-containing protein
VSPDTPATDALELMSRNDINQLPVVSNGRLEGLFSRAQVLNFLRAHSDLHGRA